MGVLRGFQELVVVVEEPVRGFVRSRGDIGRGTMCKALVVGGGTGTIIVGIKGERVVMAAGTASRA